MNLILKEKERVNIIKGGNHNVFVGTEFIIDPDRLKLSVDGRWQKEDFSGDLEIHIMGRVKTLGGLRPCESIKI